MRRDEIMAVVARWEDAMIRRDAVGMISNYAPDCVVESPFAGGPVTGRDANEQICRAWFTAFADVDTHFEELLIDDNRVMLIAMVVGTDSGGFMGLAPTGKPFRCPVVFLLTLNEEHQIAHEKRIYDFTGVLVQIGVLKAKPA